MKSITNVLFLQFFRRFASSSKIDNLCLKQTCMVNIVFFYNFFATEYCYLSSDGEFFLFKKIEVFLVKNNICNKDNFKNSLLTSEKKIKFQIMTSNKFSNYFFTNFIPSASFEKLFWKSLNQIIKVIADFFFLKKKRFKFSKNSLQICYWIKLSIFFNIREIFFFFFEYNRN
ncbi:hypothetical protein CMESO_165 (nucleomorph) [Chroomonas mesostigmatica CCMP1168]|uniref:Uncharacterized protein n=1 Tax=Chroomonas mesostigmatica CCMP1168 TaxID=1195612 RepID=J7G5J5_9CRYP|nr:hypothetical protein CMESO_165 [Chroomonas mesostigmatica CCMP1168]